MEKGRREGERTRGKEEQGGIVGKGNEAAKKKKQSVDVRVQRPQDATAPIASRPIAAAIRWIYSNPIYLR